MGQTELSMKEKDPQLAPPPSEILENGCFGGDDFYLGGEYEPVFN